MPETDQSAYGQAVRELIAGGHLEQATALIQTLSLTALPLAQLNLYRVHWP